jgi:serine/threonine-protein kinase
VLYELLTGRVPFDGESPVTIALKQVSEEPMPPSQLNPAVSPALEDVVLRAMAKDPAGASPTPTSSWRRSRRRAVGRRRDLRARRDRQLPGRAVRPAAALEEADRRNLRWLLWLLLALAIVGAGIAAYFLLQPKQLTVPDVVGRSRRRRPSASRTRASR